ncbi:DUF1579 domain-containing protein [Kiloniella antarctica]|uniref:DUF1579 domain-containing protein n=1 Tax=Kiloniella antarctica TaxID=1550907 RepID=A0ABW5BI01_9PROT
MTNTAAQNAPTHPDQAPQDQVRAFDFLMGTWNVHHRRLVERLINSDNWQEFGGQMIAQPLLGGPENYGGNMDDNVLDLPGNPYRAISLRTYDPASDKWAIWWLDGRNPHSLDVPVLGQFKDGIGTFYADDVLGGKPIKVRFRWTGTNTQIPRWEQAFSPDNGTTWEVNWTMDFSR